MTGCARPPGCVDRGVEAFTWAALHEIARESVKRGLVDAASRGGDTRRFTESATKADRDLAIDSAALTPFVGLRKRLETPFAERLLLWRRVSGPTGDLLQEIDRDPTAIFWG